jgi:hypothetical protein
LKVIVPFVSLHPATRSVLDSYRVPVQYERLDGDDAYRLLLQRLWREGETCVIIEQDILPWPGAIEELHQCCGLWCSCSYLYGGCYSLSHMLGCTKLSDRLMGLLPTLWDEPGHWSSLDTRLYHAAYAVGEVAHPHRPPVIHLNAKEMDRVRWVDA